ncbi:MAG: hypothetical protein LBQ09_03320, partial [Acidobacteriaceae bacterium]|nr:hypothetical protein [Acidobacteriaceae bacterium]
MDVVPGVLIAIGLWFLIASARIIVEVVRFKTRQKGALLLWLPPPPPRYGLMLALGVASGLLIAFEILVQHRLSFGETMMFVYFGYLVPFSRRIARGFFADGIWTDSGFIPYHEIGGISWREG